MNRYAAAGINADAAQGRRVIVITRDGAALRDALDQLTAAMHTDTPTTIRRANGAESINYPDTGGEITIRSYRQGARGITADTLYLDEAVDPLVRDTNAWTALYASLAASQHPEVIRS